MLLQVSVLGRPVPDSATSFRSILSVPDEKAVIIPARLRPDPLGRSSKRLTTTGCKWVSANARRYKGLSGTAFVQPISGETFWYISNGISKPFLAARLALFAREAGAGR